MAETSASHNGKVDALGLIYARALLELAQQDGAVDEIAEQAADVARLWASQGDLRRLLRSPALDGEKRRALIERLFAGKVHPTLYQFLQVVSRKGRLESLGGILAGFDRLLQEHRGRVGVEAHVAAPLDEAEAARVAESIGRSLGKEVVLTQRIDPSLIGGLKLRVGDRLIDGSVSAQLRAVQRQAAASGRARARELAASLSPAASQ